LGNAIQSKTKQKKKGKAIHQQRRNGAYLLQIGELVRFCGSSASLASFLFVFVFVVVVVSVQCRALDIFWAVSHLETVLGGFTLGIFNSVQINVNGPIKP
jgi:hypothetical protein